MKSWNSTWSSRLVKTTCIRCSEWGRDELAFVAIPTKVETLWQIQTSKCKHILTLKLSVISNEIKHLRHETLSLLHSMLCVLNYTFSYDDNVDREKRESTWRGSSGRVKCVARAKTKYFQSRRKDVSRFFFTRPKLSRVLSRHTFCACHSVCHVSSSFFLLLVIFVRHRREGRLDG